MNQYSGFDVAEKNQSQIPALQLFVALGFKLLLQAEAFALNSDRLRFAVLDDVLAEHEAQACAFNCRETDFALEVERAIALIRQKHSLRQKMLAGYWRVKVEVN
jgi:type I restriction enzyme R subunit